MKKRIEEIFKDLCDAPTGCVNNDFTISTLKDSHTDLFIRTVAGHLVSLNYRKQSEDTVEVVRCKDCEYHHWEQEPCHGKTVHKCSVLNAEVFKDFYCYYGKPKMKGGAE